MSCPDPTTRAVPCLSPVLSRPCSPSGLVPVPCHVPFHFDGDSKYDPAEQQDWDDPDEEWRFHDTIDEHCGYYEEIMRGVNAAKQGGADISAVAPVAAPDKPLIDAPELEHDAIRDTDKMPYWIPGAFPTIFHNATGDPYNAPHHQVDLNLWGPHVLRSKGWHAQTHMTFMYWWLNTIQRHQALSAKKWYIRDNPQANGYTVDALKGMGVRNLSKQMVGYTAGIPGTKASKAHLRKLILSMVRQMEIETRCPRSPEGDIPCIFGTLTSQRYEWDGLIRIIAEVEGIEDYKALTKNKRRTLVNKYPLFVAWYCAVRLELSLKTLVVPLVGAHSYCAVFEWSPTGGMVHVHYILWKSGAPRFDTQA